MSKKKPVIEAAMSIPADLIREWSGNALGRYALDSIMVHREWLAAQHEIFVNYQRGRHWAWEKYVTDLKKERTVIKEVTP